MNEFWEIFWNSFWKICQLEFRNVSVTNLLISSMVGAAIVHVSCMIYFRVKRHPIYLNTELMIILLISYTIFIAQVTLMSRGLENQRRVFDTKLLWIDKSMDQNITNLMNILLFIPYGILVTGIHMGRNRVRRFLLVVNYSFLASLLIECMQYITKRGYFEIDDLEANIVGGMAGSIFLSLSIKLGGLFHKKHSEVENEKETRTGDV